MPPVQARRESVPSPSSRAVLLPGGPEERLQRARRLGHGVRTAGEIHTTDSPTKVRRAVGFELEVQILLSSGRPEKSSDSEQYPFTVEDLQQGRARARPPVSFSGPSGFKVTRFHTVVLGDGSVYEWHPDETAEPDGFKVIAPVAASEIETSEGKGRWLLGGLGQREENKFYDPLLTKEEKFYSDTGVDAVEDHASASLDGRLASIVELVTHPKDEFLETEEFLAPIKRADELTQKIVEKTGTLSRRAPASDVFPGARGDLFLGSDGKYDQQASAAVQATYAVQLASYPAWQRNLASSPREPTEESKAESAILSGAADAGDIAVHQVYSQKLLESPDPGFNGLLHVLSLYLTGGREAFAKKIGNNIKNYAPLLSRAAISSLVTDGELLGGEARELLKDGEQRSKLIQILLKANLRGAGEPVIWLAGDGPTVGDWLEQVLSGKNDPLRSFGRFGRARLIPPEYVGPSEQRRKAPVFEERQVQNPSGASVLVPRGSWEDVALRYKKLLMEANSPVSSSLPTPQDTSTLSLPSLSDPIGRQLSRPPETVAPKKGDRVRLTNKKNSEEKIEGELVLVSEKYYIIGKKPYEVKNYDVELL